MGGKAKIEMVCELGPARGARRLELEGGRRPARAYRGAGDGATLRVVQRRARKHYAQREALVCAGAGSKSGGGNLLCQNEPILQIPGFNVYTRTTVEADARLGDYSECNPDPDTGTTTRVLGNAP